MRVRFAGPNRTTTKRGFRSVFDAVPTSHASWSYPPWASDQNTSGHFRIRIISACWIGAPAPSPIVGRSHRILLPRCCRKALR
ncbi:protein of unknown function [Candidatus Filomicrobium marinum]|nr:protein of unknown function [Candidatus Filomicrobium marinum]